MVSDQDGGLLSRMKERRVFLFEQIVIFSEPLDKKKGFSTPGYLFKNSIKVRTGAESILHETTSCQHTLVLNVDVQKSVFPLPCFKVNLTNAVATTTSFPLSPVLSLWNLHQVSWLGLEENAEDPCKFTLTSRSSSGNVERYTLHSTSPGVCQVWIHQVSQILENQRNFLNGERHIWIFCRWWRSRWEITCRRHEMRWEDQIKWMLSWNYNHWLSI